MAVRMAGFSVSDAIRESQGLLNKSDFIDENGKIDYKRLVEELNKISRKMSREIKLLERI